MQGYSAKIVSCSRELSAKEKIMMKDTTDCVRLDEATKSGAIIINPSAYAEIEIHNEQSENKDYKVFVVIDKDGTKYVTGSESFFSTFHDIYCDMDGEEEEWAVKVYRVPSKNYTGRDFISCSII